jgi:hypothetical protein
MGFDPCIHLLKIWESIEIPTPKMELHLGVWGFILSYSFALLKAWNVTLGLPSWPSTLQAFALVASPRLGLRQHEIHFKIDNKMYFLKWKKVEDYRVWFKLNNMLRSKHGKLDQKICPPKILFKNMTIFYKNIRKYIGKFFIFHFENIYVSIGFMVSWI